MGCSGNQNNDATFAAQSEQIRQLVQNTPRKIMVMSGKGGVGKSTVAMYIALELAAQGKKVGLLDVDLHGPSIAKMAGVTGMPLMVVDGWLQPYHLTDNLRVVTVQGLCEQIDAPLIWRGPMKIGVIRQLLAETDWGGIEYLVIDSPPGTGDEPLTIAQEIPGCEAVVVTTPQEVALADVAKSIQFCKQLNMKILGIVENMSGFVCPDCNKVHHIFGRGGGIWIAEKYGVEFLGAIPLDGSIMAAGDNASLERWSNSAGAAKMRVVVEKIIAAGAKKTSEKGARMLKIAVPVIGDEISSHFGHCEHFAFYYAAGKDVVSVEKLVPPPHEPGVLPRWLAEQKTNVVLAGGMGERAQELLIQSGIEVKCGVSGKDARAVVDNYLQGILQADGSTCKHNHDDAHSCGH